MVSRNFVMSIVAAGIFIVCVVMIYSGSSPSIKMRLQEKWKKDTDLYEITYKLIEQRNNNTKRLNLKQQKVGQMECEV